MKTSDDELEAAVLAALHEEPRVANAQLFVRVEDGVVRLTGTVSTWGVKMAALDTVRRVPGASAIRNGIEFRIGEGAGLTDADLARAVRLVLARELPALATGIVVTASAGWVTLEGTVDHWKQKGEVERAVRKLPGVLGVASKVEIGVSLTRHDPSQVSGTQA